MTSFVNLGVDLSPLCKVFPLLYVIPSSLFRSIFQFLADAILLRPQRRGCVLTWICKSYTPVLIQLPLDRRLSKHLFPDFVLDCRVSVISGLPLRLASTFEDFPYLITHSWAEAKAVLSGILFQLAIALGSPHSLCLLKKRKARKFIFMTLQSTSRFWMIKSIFVHC